MVRAKLHVICGNCGCGTDFEYRHENYPADAEEKTMCYETILKCNNCSTFHWLNDNASNENEVSEV